MAWDEVLLIGALITAAAEVSHRVRAYRLLKWGEQQARELEANPSTYITGERERAFRARMGVETR